MGESNFEEERAIFIVAEYLPTNYLVMIKGKIVALQWINPANTNFTR